MNAKLALDLIIGIPMLIYAITMLVLIIKL